MIKKAIVTTIAVALLGGFVFGRDLFSYAKTSATEVRRAVKREVPLDFEVQRARDIVEDLVPDIHDHMHLIATDQVEVERFRRDIARKEAGLARQEKAILALNDDLKTGNGTFSYASRTYTSDEVRRDLKERWDRFKTAQETLDRDRRILTHREKSLRANEERLDKMLLQKKELEVKVEQLTARLNSLRALQAAEASSAIDIDNSQLSRAEKLIAELNKQLDIKEKVLDARGKFNGLIPVETEEVVPENLTEEIDDYFHGDSQSETGNEVALEPTL